MPRYFTMTINGVPFKKGVPESQLPALERKCEEWQRGLAKHKDLRDYVEIREDRDAAKEFDEMYDTLKRGNPQINKVLQGD